MIDFGRMFYDLNPEKRDALFEETDNPLEYRILGTDGRFPPVIIVVYVDRRVTNVDIGRSLLEITRLLLQSLQRPTSGSWER